GVARDLHLRPDRPHPSRRARLMSPPTFRGRTGGSTMTARDLTDRVYEARKTAWAKSDPRTAIVATERLGPEDEKAVRRGVAAAGYRGDKLDAMVREVAARVVGRVEALADNIPVTGGD